MTAHGVTDMVSEDLQLALGESAANAVEHAYGPDEPREFELTLSRRVDGSAIDVEVTDFGRSRPPPANPGFRGRGLDLVRALAQSVRVELGLAGTTVRFTMAVPDV
jgi:anti-sigma regulatory factor (Ser/Thr protein kinase)